MELVPQISVKRFEQLDPGDLFIFFDRGHTSYAVKTQEPRSGDRGAMVLLGPTFVQDIQELYIVEWQPATVLSLGRGFSILPSLDPTSWWLTGSTRKPVCLAVADDRAYICTNGGSSPSEYFPCFVEVMSGTTVERRLPTSLVAFTHNWEIAVLESNRPPRTILKYPLPEQTNPGGLR